MFDKEACTQGARLNNQIGIMCGWKITFAWEQCIRWTEQYWQGMMKRKRIMRSKAF